MSWAYYSIDIVANQSMGRSRPRICVVGTGAQGGIPDFWGHPPGKASVAILGALLCPSWMAPRRTRDGRKRTPPFWDAPAGKKQFAHQRGSRYTRYCVIFDCGAERPPSDRRELWRSTRSVSNTACNETTRPEPSVRRPIYWRISRRRLRASR